MLGNSRGTRELAVMGCTAKNGMGMEIQQVPGGRGWKDIAAGLLQAGGIWLHQGGCGGGGLGDGRRERRAVRLSDEAALASSEPPVMRAVQN